MIMPRNDKVLQRHTHTHRSHTIHKLTSIVRTGVCIEQCISLCPVCVQCVSSVCVCVSSVCVCVYQCVGVCTSGCVCGVRVGVCPVWVCVCAVCGCVAFLCVCVCVCGEGYRMCVCDIVIPGRRQGC